MLLVDTSRAVCHVGLRSERKQSCVGAVLELVQPISAGSRQEVARDDANLVWSTWVMLGCCVSFLFCKRINISSCTDCCILKASEVI